MRELDVVGRLIQVLIRMERRQVTPQRSGRVLYFLLDPVRSTRRAIVRYVHRTMDRFERLQTRVGKKAMVREARRSLTLSRIRMHDACGVWSPTTNLESQAPGLTLCTSFPWTSRVLTLAEFQTRRERSASKWANATTTTGAGSASFQTGRGEGGK